MLAVILSLCILSLAKKKNITMWVNFVLYNILLFDEIALTLMRVRGIIITKQTDIAEP